MMQFPRDLDGESYKIMNEICKFFKHLSCDTSKYFCHWFSDMLNSRGSHETSIEWAELGLKRTNGINDRVLQSKLYKVLLVNYARLSPPNWNEFKHYYLMLTKIILTYHSVFKDTKLHA